MSLFWSTIMSVLMAIGSMASYAPPDTTYQAQHELLEGRWEMHEENLFFWYEYDHGRFRTGDNISDRVTRSRYEVLEVGEDGSILMELQSDWVSWSTEQRVHMAEDGQSYTMNGLLFEKVE